MRDLEATPEDPLVERLRAAGCVFAEDEARLLRERAAGDDELLERLARRRIGGEPLEPLIGWVDFGGRRLRVDPGCFVPRQRSLLLADAAISEVRRIRAARAARGGRHGTPGDRTVVFLEAFAGVAPIAASVEAAPATETGTPGTAILACERDDRAREAARANLGPGARLFGGEVLAGLPDSLAGGIDVIAAVPPYVPRGELAGLPREAVDYEPPEALIAGEDGLDRVRELIAQSPAWLAPGGVLLVEMHRTQAETAEGVADLAGFSSEAVHGDDGQTIVLRLALRT